MGAVNAVNFGNFCNYTHDNHTIQFNDNNESVRAGVQEIIDSGVYYLDAHVVSDTYWWKINVTGATILYIERRESPVSEYSNASVSYNPILVMPDGSTNGILSFSSSHPKC